MIDNIVCSVTKERLQFEFPDATRLTISGRWDNLEPLGKEIRKEYPFFPFRAFVEVVATRFSLECARLEGETVFLATCNGEIDDKPS